MQYKWFVYIRLHGPNPAVHTHTERFTQAFPQNAKYSIHLFPHANFVHICNANDLIIY